MWDIKLKFIDVNNSIVVIRGKGVGATKGKGAKYIVMEDNLTLGVGHIMQCTDHISKGCIPETYIISLTNASPINLIKNK